MQLPPGAHRKAEVKLTLPYPPSANRYWRIYRGKTVTSSEALVYKKEANYTARQQGAVLHPTGTQVIVDAAFYRPRQIGDLDNRLKVLLDSLIGVCYEDDEQVVELHARRYEDRLNPRVEVTVEARV